MYVYIRPELTCWNEEVLLVLVGVRPLIRLIGLIRQSGFLIGLVWTKKKQVLMRHVDQVAPRKKVWMWKDRSNKFYRRKVFKSLLRVKNFFNLTYSSLTTPKNTFLCPYATNRLSFLRPTLIPILVKDIPDPKQHLIRKVLGWQTARKLWGLLGNWIVTHKGPHYWW